MYFWHEENMEVYLLVYLEEYGTLYFYLFSYNPLSMECIPMFDL